MHRTQTDDNANAHYAPFLVPSCNLAGQVSNQFDMLAHNLDSSEVDSHHLYHNDPSIQEDITTFFPESDAFENNGFIFSTLQMGRNGVNADMEG
ncbi:hypothetical protein V5O48_015005, partial [Marasmius crinis-equi]